MKIKYRIVTNLVNILTIGLVVNFLFTCTSQEILDKKSNYDDSNWIVLSTESTGKNNFVRSMNGWLVRLGKDSISIANPYDTTILFSVYETSDSDTLNEGASIFKSIKHIENDTIELLSLDSTFVIKCRRLKETTNTISKSELINRYLSRSSFQFHGDSVHFNYYIDTINHYLDTPIYFKDFLVYEDVNGIYDFSYDKGLHDENWSIKEFYGDILLIHSMGGVGFTDYVMYQILDYTNDSLFVHQVVSNYYVDDRYGILKSSTQKKGELLEIKDKLLGDWIAVEIVDLDNIFENIDSNGGYMNTNVITSYHQNRIFKRNLLKVENDIKIKFEGSMYELSIKDYVINKENKDWILTMDGRYLRLNYGFSGEEYVEIEELSTNKIVLTTFVFIQSEIRKRHCYPVKLKISFHRI